MADRIEVSIRVIPRARADRVDGLRADRLLVRVVAAPVDGAANRAVRRVLGDALGVPATAVRIERGATAHDKVVSVPASAAEALARLVK